jgi:hypothetical protein
VVILILKTNKEKEKLAQARSWFEKKINQKGLGRFFLTKKTKF